MYNKDEISRYSDLRYNNHERYGISIITGDIANEEESIGFEEFAENLTTEVSYENDYFYQMNVNRFGNKLLLEFIKLGDEEGYYKDWSYKKFMETLKEVCDCIDIVYVNNYDKSEDDPFFRAFFLSMLVDTNEYKNFNQVYIECGNLCESLIKITEDRLRGIWWNPIFETDEILFCRVFLTPFLSKLGFEKVIFNHGNTEFGKDYILQTTNIFGTKEFYGVQVKAGNLSGSASRNIGELVNQINMAFKVPYKTIDQNKIYMAKIIIAISGYYSENAKERIYSELEPYKFSNVVFLSKRELSSLSLGSS